MWVDCGLDLVAIKEEIQNSGSYFSKGSVLDSTEISLREDLLAKGTVQEAISLLSPEVNHTFFNCLISQNFPLDGSRKDSLRSWFVDYLESLRPPARRYLAAQSQDSETDPRSKNGVVPQNSSDNNALLMAVALTAAVTSITVALLFLCFFKCQRRTHYPGYSMKDDKPLLSLSLSDYSGMEMFFFLFIFFSQYRLIFSIYAVLILFLLCLQQVLHIILLPLQTVY